MSNSGSELEYGYQDYQKLCDKHNEYCYGIDSWNWRDCYQKLMEKEKSSEVVGDTFTPPLTGVTDLGEQTISDSLTERYQKAAKLLEAMECSGEFIPTEPKKSEVTKKKFFEIESIGTVDLSKITFMSSTYLKGLSLVIDGQIVTWERVSEATKTKLLKAWKSYHNEG